MVGAGLNIIESSNFQVFRQMQKSGNVGHQLQQQRFRQAAHTWGS
jgi:hypothetical protein